MHLCSSCNRRTKNSVMMMMMIWLKSHCSTHIRMSTDWNHFLTVFSKKNCILACSRATFTPAEIEADHTDLLHLEWCILPYRHGSVVKAASTTTDRATSVRGRTYTSATACEVTAADTSTVLVRGTTVTRPTAMDHQYTIVLTQVVEGHTWWWTETRRLSVT